MAKIEHLKVISPHFSGSLHDFEVSPPILLKFASFQTTFQRANFLKNGQLFHFGGGKFSNSENLKFKSLFFRKFAVFKFSPLRGLRLKTSPLGG